MRNTRKVVTSGLVALVATATLAACGEAPEEESGDSGSDAWATKRPACAGSLASIGAQYATLAVSRARSTRARRPSPTAMVHRRTSDAPGTSGAG